MTINKNNRIQIKSNDKTKLLQLERFVMHMSDFTLYRIEKLAYKKSCTKSWIVRAVLYALAKKYPNSLPAKIKIQRPKKFKIPFRQSTICFHHGDKKKWMSLSRIWQVELGPLIRYGLDLFFAGELELDFDSSKTVKEIKIPFTGKKTRKRKKRKCDRYIYLYQTEAICYEKEEFWQKNSNGNIFLMEWGLKNRIYPLVL